MDVFRRERLLNWRNGWLASPEFQHAMADNPLTRWFARRRAREMFDLVAGFVYSQTLAACVRTGVIDLLASGAQTDIVVAERTGLSPDAASRLLRAGAALKLVEPAGGGRWVLGTVGAALAGNSGLVEMVRHHSLLYADMADPVALLARGRGRLAHFWDYDGQDGERAAVYSRLMTASQPLIMRQVLGAYRFHRHRRLLDIGGGEGAFVQAALERAPKLRATVLDLPAVAKRARHRLAEAGLSGRADVIAGDFHCDPFPTGHDLITLVRVLHDHDDQAATALLVAARRALAPGGRLVIAEPMAGTRGAKPAGDAYFGWYLLAMGSGRPRSTDELVAMARAAGFRRVHVPRTILPLVCRMIVAE